MFFHILDITICFCAYCFLSYVLSSLKKLVGDYIERVSWVLIYAQ